MTHASPLRLFMAAIALALAVASFAAEELSLAAVLSGKVAPLSFTFGELGTGWSQFSLASANWMESLMFSEGNDAREAAFLQRFADYFTRGEIIVSNGETFLLAYRRPNPFDRAGEMARLLHLTGAEESDLPDELAIVRRIVITRETRLSLSLLNTKTLHNLLDIRPVDVQAELTASAQVLDAAEKRAGMPLSISNLRQVVLAMQMYVQDHNENLPRMTTEAAFWVMLGVVDKVSRHPVTKERYRYNPALSGKALGVIKSPADTPAFYEATPWPDGSRFIAYIDGHVGAVTADAWTRMQAKWKLP